MEPLLAFAAALLSVRLAGRLVARWRERRAPELAAWAASLAAFALASAALAWGSAAGWSAPAFRVYYLFGGLLTAPLLGVGSLLRWRRLRGVAAAGFAWAGLSVGLAVAVPLEAPVAGQAIPDASDQLAFVPARLAAVVGNSLGTLAVLAVALATFRRRPLGNGLLVAGVGVAALGSALFGLGVAGTAASLALAALLLYAGFVAGPRAFPSRAQPDPQPEAADQDDRRELGDQTGRAAVGEGRRHR